MSDKIKSFGAGVLVTLLLVCGTVFAEKIHKTIDAVYRDIQIFVNGEFVVPTDADGNVAEPFIVDGTTYLPVRAISNALGCEVFWDDETSSISIWDKEHQGTTDPEYGDISFVDIFELADQDNGFRFVRIGSSEMNHAELAFGLVASSAQTDGSALVSVHGSGYHITDSTETYAALLYEHIMEVMGDTVIYKYYNLDSTRDASDGQIVICLMPNGNMMVEQYGDLGSEVNIDFTGEYEFVETEDSEE